MQEAGRARLDLSRGSLQRSRGAAGPFEFRPPVTALARLLALARGKPRDGARQAVAAAHQRALGGVRP